MDGAVWPIEFDSPAALRRAMQRLADEALATRARRLVLVDADLLAWPLDDGDFLEALTRWIRLPERRLVLLAERYAALALQRPRFVAWRRIWAHAIVALQAADEAMVLPAAALLDRRLALRIIDPPRSRGWLDADGRRAQALADEIDALTQRCETSFPASTLGL